MKVLKKIFEIGSCILIGIVLASIIASFVRLSVVNGSSMIPTLEDKDVLLVNMNSYKKNSPQHGDIIIIERNDLEIRHFVKRVIATENEKITIKDNKVYINDELIVEEYINGEMATKDFEAIIPEGYVFVMGDNRNNSLDSRSGIIGMVSVEDEILGKTFKLF